MKYDFTAIEKKWQTKWKDEKTFACQNGDTSKPKFYGLVEFPYPSGAGLSYPSILYYQTAKLLTSAPICRK